MVVVNKPASIPVRDSADADADCKKAMANKMNAYYTRDRA